MIIQPPVLVGTGKVASIIAYDVVGCAASSTQYFWNFFDCYDSDGTSLSISSEDFELRLEFTNQLIPTSILMVNDIYVEFYYDDSIDWLRNSFTVKA